MSKYFKTLKYLRSALANFCSQNIGIVKFAVIIWKLKKLLKVLKIQADK